MAQAPLFQRAQQGDVAAIAALINRHAKPRGVVAHVSLHHHCLHVILESQQPPAQVFWTPYLTRSLHRLGAAAISQLCLYGRCYGATRSTWSETIELYDSAAQVPTSIANSLPDTVPTTERYRVTSQAAIRRTAIPQRAAYATGISSRSSKRRFRQGASHPGRGMSVGRFLGQQVSQFNLTLALQWCTSTLLAATGAVVLYRWGLSISAIAEAADSLPPLALRLLGVGGFGWLLGWAQAHCLKNWVVSSDRWVTVTVIGAVVAQVFAFLEIGTSYLALAVLGGCQWTALRRWLPGTYIWVLGHIAMSIVAPAIVSLSAPGITGAGWGGAIAARLATEYALAVQLCLVCLVYSLGSAIIMGKLFYRP